MPSSSPVYPKDAGRSFRICVGGRGGPRVTQDTFRFISKSVPEDEVWGCLTKLSDGRMTIKKFKRALEDSKVYTLYPVRGFVHHKVIYICNSILYGYFGTSLWYDFVQKCEDSIRVVLLISHISEFLANAF